MLGNVWSGKARLSHVVSLGHDRSDYVRLGHVSQGQVTSCY